jgi:CheY-like chemotaxis protein
MTTDRIGSIPSGQCQMPSVPPPPDRVTSTPFRGFVVLVVGDDLSVLATTQQRLERLGALVRTAHNVEGGLRAALRHRPHLILIDLDMPHMGGVELARHLRQEAQLGRTRLVALTSPPGRLTTMKGWRIEFDGRIRKPVTEQALAALARHLPGGRASPAE